jgi:uncharacterized membrane protein YtjA (UPF0391 family)
MIFLLVALAAMLFGSGHVAGLASGIGQMLLIGFVALAILGMIVSALRSA